MKTSTCLRVRLLLGLLVAGAAAGCVDSPYDEEVIASQTTAVNFHGFTTSDVGTHDDADTAAKTFYVFAWNPATYRLVELSAPVHPSIIPWKHGNYDWHALSFGDLVIPTWAWDDEPTRWHAQLRIADGNNWLWTLFAFTPEEMGCYLDAIADGESVAGAAVACGGDFDIDLYVNK